MKTMLHALVLPLLLSCAADVSEQQDTCEAVPASFIASVERTLSDTTGRFATDYPKPTPLTCELLLGLDSAMKDDSVRYHFAHLHQRYADPRASAAFTYIRRHNDFHLAMALTTHWNPDTRIEAVRAVHNYRRIRPLVCTTQEGYAKLLDQDRAAVRYFIRVLETTPRWIPGSENSTIHDIYIREVMETLDIFTGYTHELEGDQRMRVDMSEQRFEQAMEDWRNWLKE